VTPAMRDTLIRVDGASRRFVVRRHAPASIKEGVIGAARTRRPVADAQFWALRDVSLSVGRGESVGLVGPNGSGKSTLLKLVAGIHRPTTGRILVRPGLRVGTMIELGVGFHPELSGRANVYLNASVYGLSRADVDRRYDAIVEYAGLADFMDERVGHFSSGMVVRLAFAVVAHLDADVLLLDEVYAVGDLAFQEKCRATLQGMLARERAIVFVSHQAAAVAALCGRVCVLDHGRLIFDGATADGLAAYRDLAPQAG
jgi:ABC-2 type transport system ATP-binding protein